MRVTIVGPTDYALWTEGMTASGGTDIYYSAEYHKLHHTQSDRCMAYLATDDKETLFHPFLLRPIRRIGTTEISSQLNDIVSVYGYTGAIATNDCPAFLREAWQGFDAWCHDNGVVTEFIRFNPLLRADRFAAPQMDVQLKRQTIIVSLDGDEDTLWRSYPSTQRNRIRKATKQGLVFREGDLNQHLEIFVRLYEATMKRCGASEFYFFACSYYEALQRDLPANARLFFVEYQGEPIAGGLFLLAGQTIHYHLGGSSADAQHHAPNNLLFHKVAVWAQQHGFNALHLGGGRSDAPDDLLLRFKKGFSRQALPFHVGQRIHNQLEYNKLCDTWISHYGEPISTVYFPPYRALTGQQVLSNNAA